ncbi:lipopolysaccharide assembly protein LapB [Sebaldella sp. S0638]|uniref:tetratricopeptide repeat protein n=1 Tax=Sebaldella sp. S0638 TaxID=2957809 RepID=UPI00209FE739|nr:tetratricopeptide repeat protein [Sebaldella sp. S0638]MCP1226027.1 tetratricopeptide repeat protein [Sebaldella sp. S0638]
MRRCLVILFLLLLSLNSCKFSGSNSKGYKELEEGIIKIFDNKDGMADFSAAARKGNLEVYGVVTYYYGYSALDFLEKHFKKSDGRAEYYYASILISANNDEDKAKKLFEEAVKQGEYNAYYSLGTLYEEDLDYSTAMNYYEKGREKGDMFSLYAYEYLKTNKNSINKIETFGKKYKSGTITSDEKKEMGKLILEKFSNYGKAYDILKEFVAEKYPPALYAKAKILQNEDKEGEAAAIFNELYSKDKYYLGTFEMAFYEVNNQNFEKALSYLEDGSYNESLIYAYKGYIYRHLKLFKKAEENYKKAVDLKDIDAIYYLGMLYRDQGDLEKAKKYFEAGYKLGSIPSGYNYAYTVADLQKEKKLQKESGNTKNIDIEALGRNDISKKVYENLSKQGDYASMINLSTYYKEGSEEMRSLNLIAASRGYPVAFSNLGVYYMRHKNKAKANYWFGLAKEAEGFTTVEN